MASRRKQRKQRKGGASAEGEWVLWGYAKGCEGVTYEARLGREQLFKPNGKRRSITSLLPPGRVRHTSTFFVTKRDQTR